MSSAAVTLALLRVTPLLRFISQSWWKNNTVWSWNYVYGRALSIKKTTWYGYSNEFCSFVIVVEAFIDSVKGSGRK